MSRTTRKPLTRGKSVSSGCRNNGSCPFCKSNRTHKHKRSGIQELNEQHESSSPS